MSWRVKQSDNFEISPLAPIGNRLRQFQAGVSRVQTRAGRCLFLYVLEAEGTGATEALDVGGVSDTAQLSDPALSGLPKTGNLIEVMMATNSPILAVGCTTGSTCLDQNSRSRGYLGLGDEEWPWMDMTHLGEAGRGHEPSP